MRCDRTLDNAEQVRANLVGAALVAGVTADAFLEDRFANGGIGACQERGNRRLRSCGGIGASLSLRRSFGDDRIAFLLRNLRVENCLPTRWIRSSGRKRCQEEHQRPCSHMSSSANAPMQPADQRPDDLEIARNLCLLLDSCNTIVVPNSGLFDTFPA